MNASDVFESYGEDSALVFWRIASCERASRHLASTVGDEAAPYTPLLVFTVPASGMMEDANVCARSTEVVVKRGAEGKAAAEI